MSDPWDPDTSFARPDPPRPIAEVARAWLSSVGLARVGVWALCVVLVVIGGWWLVRPPAAPVEDSLPLASAAAPPSTTVVSVGSSPMPAASTDEVVVHVAGAVRKPGLYRLPTGSRVADAVDRAGGPSRRADLDGVNLAALVADGQQIRVPREGDPLPTPTDLPDAPSGPVDLNTASAEELDGLPGIGPSIAAAIVRHRDDNGPFASVDDLLDVAGIGPSKLDAVRDLVTV